MVLIVGGTGRLGTQVVQLLVKRPTRVRVLTRDRTRAKHLTSDLIEVVQGDVRERASLKPAVAGVSTVVSAVQGLDDKKSSPEATDRDGVQNLIEAAKEAGVPHFVLVSVMGASPDHPVSFYRAKYASEQTLKKSGLAWTIIRPSAFMEFWGKLIGEPVAATGRARVFGRGTNPVNFVSIRDVATAVEKAVSDPSLRGVELEVGGPENVTLNQIVQIYEQASAKEAKVSHIPVPAMRVMSVLVRPFNPAIARLVKAGIVMDRADMTWDPSRNRALYPWLPQTRFEEVVGRQPVQDAARPPLHR
jgi:NADH dehydrogenase